MRPHAKGWNNGDGITLLVGSADTVRYGGGADDQLPQYSWFVLVLARLSRWPPLARAPLLPDPKHPSKCHIHHRRSCNTDRKATRTIGKQYKLPLKCLIIFSIYLKAFGFSCMLLPMLLSKLSKWISFSQFNPLLHPAIKTIEEAFMAACYIRNIGLHLQCRIVEVFFVVSPNFHIP